jgi:hypothetical protein
MAAMYATQGQHLARICGVRYQPVPDSHRQQDDRADAERPRRHRGRVVAAPGLPEPPRHQRGLGVSGSRQRQHDPQRPHRAARIAQD